MSVLRPANEKWKFFALLVPLFLVFFLSAPDAKEQNSAKIFVSRFMVKDATLIDSETIKAIVAPYENKELTLREINALGEKITNEYRRKGYILAYAYIPAQEIKNSVVVIRIIEGKVGRITVSGNKRVSTEFIAGHLEKTGKDPSLKKDRLERALLILNDTPCLNVKSTLKAGKEPGTTDISVQVKEGFPLSGSITYDNFGSNVVSKNRAGIHIAAGSLITSGDCLILRGLTGIDRIDPGKLSYGRAEYQLPLGYNGTKVGGYYANGIYEAGEQYAFMDIYGKAHATGIYLTHPFIHQRGRRMDVRLGFDYKDVYDYILDSRRAKDNIRVFNIGVAYDFMDRFYGRNLISLAGYQGIGDLFGGNGQDDPGTSRLHADGQFRKYVADLVRVQAITENIYLNLRGSGQISNDALFAGEQMYIGGVDGVRGSQTYALGGDSGYVLNAELYLPPLFPETRIFNQTLGNTIKLVLFADHGGVYRNDVQPGEHRDDYLTSAGVGVRLTAGKRFSMRLDWAVPRVGGDFDAGRAQTYVQAAMSF